MLVFADGKGKQTIRKKRRRKKAKHDEYLLS